MVISLNNGFMVLIIRVFLTILFIFSFKKQLLLSGYIKTTITGANVVEGVQMDLFIVFIG